jgi:hypothetical protein
MMMVMMMMIIITNDAKFVKKQRYKY